MLSKKIRVAFICNTFVHGGLEALLLNYLSEAPDDFVVDLYVCENSDNIPFEQVEAKGGKVYICPPLKKFFKYKQFLKTSFLKNKYDIVQANMNSVSFIPLKIAKKCGVEVRITYSLSSSNKKEFLRHMLKNIFKLFSKKYSNVYFANSDLSAVWLFGRGILKNPNYFKFPNCIEEKEFNFNKKSREFFRKQFGLGDKFVIGNVGRLVTQKNQLFLLDVFKHIVSLQDNSCLVIAGDGPLKTKLQEKIKLLNLTDHVILLGKEELGFNDGVKKLYSACDVFVLPSLYEGLPVSGIEAQISGLPCVFSTEVTEETKISEDVIFLSLKNSPATWAKQIISLKGTVRNEKVYHPCYDRKVQSINLFNKYRELLRK